MLLKIAAYEDMIMNVNGPMDYDPYYDPTAFSALDDRATIAQMQNNFQSGVLGGMGTNPLATAAELAAVVGGLGLVGHGLSSGSSLATSLGTTLGLSGTAGLLF